MIDSHVHLDDEKYDEDREEIIENLEKNGLDRVYNIGADIESSRNSVELANKYERIYAVVGIHPHDATSYNEEIEEELREMVQNNKKVRAIGEIGLDYYYDNSPRDIQKDVFQKQIHLAGKLGKPIVIHSREASQDTLDFVKYAKKEYPEMKILIHSYTQSVEMLREYVKQGCSIALGGVVTFKNANNVKNVAQEVPIENLLLETDSPYLTPEPRRGRRNEPANVRYIAEKIAEIRNMDVERLIEKTDENTLRFFGDI